MLKLRQTRDRAALGETRKVHLGEVDFEIAHDQLHAPPLPEWTPTTLEQCRRIYDRYVQPGAGAAIPNAKFCDTPKWLFLEYTVRVRGLLLQGSNESDYEELPAKRLSLSLIGWEEPCHFAYSNATEAMFDAVLDRAMLDRLDCSLRSSTVQPDPATGEPKFYFGLDYRARAHGPWRTGTVYLYDPADFPADFHSRPFHSPTPIRPLARLQVEPYDWPLLDRVDGVDLVAQTRRNWDTYRGYPWRDCTEVHPHRALRAEAMAIRSFVDAHFAEPIGLDQIGRRFGVSAFTALRTFRAETGLTPHAFQLIRRLDAAKSLLRQGNPIGQTAVEVGFSDQAHLTRHFKRALGLTPGQYLRVQDSSRRD
jgi:AraC-like DNA-binding protein